MHLSFSVIYWTRLITFSPFHWTASWSFLKKARQEAPESGLAWPKEERSAARQSPRRECPPNVRAAWPTGAWSSSPFLRLLTPSWASFSVSSTSAYQTKIRLTPRSTSTRQLRYWHRQPQELHRSLISSPYSSIQQTYSSFFTFHRRHLHHHPRMINIVPRPPSSFGCTRE
jgi:hypothetical protein